MSAIKYSQTSDIKLPDDHIPDPQDNHKIFYSITNSSLGNNRTSIYSSQKLHQQLSIVSNPESLIAKKIKSDWRITAEFFSLFIIISVLFVGVVLAAIIVCSLYGFHFVLSTIMLAMVPLLFIAAIIFLILGVKSGVTDEYLVTSIKGKYTALAAHMSFCKQKEKDKIIGNIVEETIKVSEKKTEQEERSFQDIIVPIIRCSDNMLLFPYGIFRDNGKVSMPMTYVDANGVEQNITGYYKYLGDTSLISQKVLRKLFMSFDLMKPNVTTQISETD